MTRSLKIVAYLVVLAYLIVMGIVIYWYFQPSLVFRLAPVGHVSQLEGESVVIDIPIKSYLSISHFFLYTKTVDLNGNVLRQTKTAEFETTDKYKVITYSKLPPGDYNIVMNVEYQLNPIAWRHQEFTLVVLSVKKGIDE